MPERWYWYYKGVYFISFPLNSSGSPHAILKFICVLKHRVTSYILITCWYINGTICKYEAYYRLNFQNTQFVIFAMYFMLPKTFSCFCYRFIHHKNHYTACISASIKKDIKNHTRHGGSCRNNFIANNISSQHNHKTPFTGTYVVVIHSPNFKVYTTWHSTNLFIHYLL